MDKGAWSGQAHRVGSTWKEGPGAGVFEQLPHQPGTQAEGALVGDAAAPSLPSPPTPWRRAPAPPQAPAGCWNPRTAGGTVWVGPSNSHRNYWLCAIRDNYA